jgi:hypothetical protein
MNAWALLAGLVFCSGCRRAPEPPRQAPAPVDTSPLAVPVTAPMAARDRLLHDLGRQQQQARERAELAETAADRDR